MLEGGGRYGVLGGGGLQVVSSFSPNSNCVTLLKRHICAIPVFLISDIAILYFSKRHFPGMALINMSF